jgi:hypothetical protein
VSFSKEFLIGFTQPLRDFIGGLLFYSVYSILGFPIESTITVPGGYLFNLWLFLEIYVIVSVADNILGMIRDATVPRENPMDVTMRLVGAAMGIFVWGSGLIDVYVTMGGNLVDAILSVILAGACLLGGLYARTRFSINRSREMSRVEREFRP